MKQLLKLILISKVPSKDKHYCLHVVTQSTNVYVLLLPRISLCHQLTHVEKEREREKRVGRERESDRETERRKRQRDSV